MSDHWRCCDADLDRVKDFFDGEPEAEAGRPFSFFSESDLLESENETLRVGLSAVFGL